MTVPDEYHGREQTWLKHQVLRQYLSKWSYKLGSVGRTRSTRLWYVDCFAGPWRSQSEAVADTSVSIGLAVLNEVVAEWTARGASLTAGAIFVEANRASYEALTDHVHRARGAITAHVLHGEFGAQVPTIRKLLAEDAAFVFVDPTGWKGVGMRHIAKLVDQPFRDVMINVMFDFLNRFKGEEERLWLRAQLCEFFDIADNAELRGLSEWELLARYRARLKELSGLSYALDLAIADPIKRRTYFHLVCGGRHPDVVSLFRDVEAAVVGREAAVVRADARRRKDANPTLSLFDSKDVTSDDLPYRRLHDEGLLLARRHLNAVLDHRPTRFGDLWPGTLEVAHITRRELGALIIEMTTEGRITVDGMGPRERTIKDEHRLTLNEAYRKT